MKIEVNALSKLANRVFSNRPGELSRSLIYLTDMIGSNYQDKWMAAVQNDDEGLWNEMRRRYLEKGADINARGDLGATPLLSICDHTSGHPGTVRHMIEAGADPNIQDTYMGFSPLMYAAMKGNFALMKVLAEGGGDVKAETFDKKLSVMGFLIGNVEYQCRNNPQEGRDCFQYLLDHGVTLTKDDKRSIFRSAPSLAPLVPGMAEAVEMETASKDGDLAALRAALDKKISPDASATFSDDTPLIRAICRPDHDEEVDMLLAAGADMNLRAHGSHMTPLQAAAFAGNQKVFTRLLMAGADTQATLPGGKPADLMAMARKGDKSGMEEFVRQSLDNYALAKQEEGVDHTVTVTRPLHLVPRKLSV